MKSLTKAGQVIIYRIHFLLRMVWNMELLYRYFFSTL